MPDTNEIANQIRAKAIELGFSACGFSPVERLEEIEPLFTQWLDQGYPGEMDFLKRNSELRVDPGLMVPEARTIISLAAGYHDPEAPPSIPISRYARGKDYHKVLRTYARKLILWINKEIGPAEGRICCDSAPLFEKEWARRSGLGWIGKNGLLLLPGQGSWFFLCEIVTDLEISEPAAIISDRCGSCTRCIEACPTGALIGPGRLDPRSCIAYLTIEQRTELPAAFIGRWSHTVYGCDICQEVCPWNQDALATPLMEFKPKAGMVALTMKDIPLLNLPMFSELFDGTPVNRAGLSVILRNFEFLAKERLS